MPPSRPLRAPLKACVADNVADPTSADPLFFRTSVALGRAWLDGGNRATMLLGGGGHCGVHSWYALLVCLDDGTRRLLRGAPAHA